MNVSLKGLSSHELIDLSKKARELATDLRGREPSTALCLENGIEDKSYPTQRYGVIPSYSGSCVVVMENGEQWLCKGHRPQGTAEYVSRNGYIEKTLISD